ncbi:hypothetical protein VHEMI00991 [[Torrubiella] hemipterigena]|uniref:Uncharacterized protein n=1 Tax=[Torrubiella] hemipterigena TaxID=1531966 RepID=A0A0A1SRW5_9HYPO|nr:hypothetical protein VHEMI00991 [[Torrubiella] hemipterigena]
MTLFPGVAFITGAGSGIGRQTAITFVAEGCRKIAVADRDQAAINETRDLVLNIAPDADILPVVVDVRNEANVVSGLALTIEHFHRIDYAVNCAGIFGPGAVSIDMPLADFDNVAAVNYRGVWLCSREEAKHMRNQEPLPTHDGRPGCRGSIINIASDLGLNTQPGRTTYCSTKAAVMHMTKSDAVDYSKHNIRVNCVAPGLVDTPLAAAIPNDGPTVEPILLKRKATPQEIADVITFVSSSKASYMLGSVTLVDGGITVS